MAIYNIYLLHLMIPGMLILLSQSIMIQRILGMSLGYSEKRPTCSVLQLIRLTFINIKGMMTFSTMVFISALIPILNELEESLKLDSVTMEISGLHPAVHVKSTDCRLNGNPMAADILVFSHIIQCSVMGTIKG